MSDHKWHHWHPGSGSDDARCSPLSGKCNSVKSIYVYLIFTEAFKKKFDISQEIIWAIYFFGGDKNPSDSPCSPRPVTNVRLFFKAFLLCTFDTKLGFLYLHWEEENKIEYSLLLYPWLYINRAQSSENVLRRNLSGNFVKMFKYISIPRARDWLELLCALEKFLKFITVLMYNFSFFQVLFSRNRKFRMTGSRAGMMSCSSLTMLVVSGEPGTSRETNWNGELTQVLLVPSLCSPPAHTIGQITTQHQE